MNAVKASVDMVLLRLLLLDPEISEAPFLYSDTHHIVHDVETQIGIMFSVSLNRIHEDDLNRIDRMYLTEENMYDRLRPSAAIKLRLFNKLLGEISSNGKSLKKISFDYGKVFNEIYDRRTEMFSMVCNKYSDIAFKTKKHFDNDNDPMFNDSFLVGVYTPLGIVTYHFKMKYFDMFNVPEIEHGPKYDNYTIQDCLYRLASIVDENMVKEHLRIRSNK